MAEVVGLVIGGVSLATIFSAAIGLCECVHFSKSFGQDYETALTKLSIIRLRLSRWAAAVQAQDRDFATEQDGIEALRILERIKHLFEQTRRLSLKYEGSPALYDPIDETRRDIRKFVSTIAKVVSKRVSLRQKRTNSFKKTVWAVYDKDKFNQLLNDVTMLVDGLVDLFPPERMPELAEKQEALCEEDLDMLVGEKKIPLEILANAAVKTDETLRSMIEMRLNPQPTHIYIENEINGRARVKFGDEYLDGYTGQSGPSSGNIYRNNTISGEGFVHFGNTYGGQSFFETSIAVDAYR